MKQGDARILRDVKLSANRGMVLDRNGEPLAVSTPVDTVWADPRKLANFSGDYARLAKALDRDPQWLARRVTSSLDREFVYLVRHMRPQDAAKVKALGIPGVDTLREYRRYYPAGEVTGHLLGFTNVDDVGQEGVELAFDQWLGGERGEHARHARPRRPHDRGSSSAPRRRSRGRTCAPASTCACNTSRTARSSRPCTRTTRAAARWSCSTSRPARCSRWSTSRRSIRTTASSTCRRATATARPTTSSSRVRASSRSSSQPA